MSIESMDIVQSEWAPWTLSRLSTDSMDNVGCCSGSPWIQWTFYRQESRKTVSDTPADQSQQLLFKSAFTTLMYDRY